MANNQCRLRKYLRKKRRARGSVAFNRLTRLYWRYHFKVHGPHVNLWAVEDTL